MRFEHESVMPREVLELLVTNRQGIYVDATLGGAGHTVRLLESYPDIRIIGIDQDDQALDYARSKIEPFQDRAQAVKGNFRYLTELLASMGLEQVDGVLFDLGVSSPQLDRAERGFSYQHEDAPLDMRMDSDNPVTAFRLVNTKSEQEIAQAIRTWGEERWASRIAAFIVNARKTEPIRTTGQLVDVIRAAIPAAARRQGGHPARRTFQALRIWVNDEMGALQDGVQEAWRVLAPGGRIAVISFHSLEDRIVKHQFRDWHNQHLARLITKHPLTADAAELDGNPRARSAKLRVVEKLAS
ncbi:16S rRNA (cytosine(1402)-N(4))-methyltransferase RsmH [Sulfobacillus harzensis]|uniref:Ribosomal RNA small subunit methyltransferase H n=1 Tax=Sulfobacillus harzensis TaxID=2729629 RepID=A0A7Y0L1J9_9FIRM|nr:16S rRNA (cytosine(1402)-N(4))-methyltransferase RsmH [Sulfobacillus harzensis]